jgi:hypothetical protein
MLLLLLLHNDRSFTFLTRFSRANHINSLISQAFRHVTLSHVTRETTEFDEIAFVVRTLSVNTATRRKIRLSQDGSTALALSLLITVLPARSSSIN